MRRAAFTTVLLFLVQAGLCAHTGFGARVIFAPGTAMAGGTCMGMDAGAPQSHPAESPAQRCKRHCASYAWSVPAAAARPLHAGVFWLPLPPVSAEPPVGAVAPPLAPERAPPAVPARLRFSSLQI